MAGLIEQINALEPGFIRVYRDSAQDIGFREAILFLDDEKIGHVNYKQVFEIRVRPGEHTLYAYNRMNKSEKISFEIKPGERVTFQVKNSGGFWFIIFSMIGVGIPKIHLVQEAASASEGRPEKVSRRLLR